MRERERESVCVCVCVGSGRRDTHHKVTLRSVAAAGSVLEGACSDSTSALCSRRASRLDVCHPTSLLPLSLSSRVLAPSVTD